jgi:glycosyltransferase involved in cell wall biosynthesis
VEGGIRVVATVRVLMCGSIPPEWGGSTGGGVASFHRTLIEEFLSREREYGLEIAGLIPFNLDPASSLRPPVPDVREAPDRASEADFYDRTLQETRAEVVLFQHIAHRWAVYHSRLKQAVPAIGVVHSWHAVTFRTPEAASRVRQTIQRALPGCDHLVFVSEHTRTEGERLGFSYPAQTSVINNPLGGAYMQAPPVAADERRGWVFVGSLINRKNPMTALEAAAKCGEHLTIIGEGPEEAALRSAAARLGTEDRVTFVGWAPPERVREALLRAELLCLPSLSEGFSLAYLEALACGTPVVGTGANVEEIAERIGLACGAPIREGTVDEVAAAARSMHESAWDRTELRRRVVDTFSPKAVAAAYALVLRDTALGAHGATPHPPRIS